MRSSVGLDVASFSNLSPVLVIPPASVLTSNGFGTFLGANYAFFNRFHLPAPGAYRYVNFTTGVASGNIQVGVVKLSGANALTYTRVMNSGIIACPVAGNTRVDCGLTTLAAGDYSLFFWADNTTVTIGLGNVASYAGARVMTIDIPGAGGVPASGTFAAWGQRCVQGLTLEQDV